MHEGEMELPEFIQVMTTTLTQRATEAAQEGEEERNSVQQAVLPFDITATAYRR